MIVAVIGFVIYSVFKGKGRQASASTAGRAFSGMHCMTCGVEGPTKTRTRGSIAIEVILWLCFLVPGLIYSVWRLTTRREVCASCGAENIIPIESPAAIQHRRVLASGGAPDVPQRRDEYAGISQPR